MRKNLKCITGDDLHLTRSVRRRNLAWVTKTLTPEGVSYNRGPRFICCWKILKCSPPRTTSSPAPAHLNETIPPSPSAPPASAASAENASPRRPAPCWKESSARNLFPDQYPDRSCESVRCSADLSQTQYHASLRPPTASARSP